jgi:hypothetical protein
MNADVKITGGEAPLPYQAEVLKQQLDDKIKREAWRERNRVLLQYSNELEDVNGDYLKLSSADFIAKYRERV